MTGQRMQHPGRYGHLHVIRELDDHAICHIAAESTDDLYVFAVEGMVTIVNDGGGRFMSSVRMRCGIRTRPTYWKLASICGSSKTPWAIAVPGRPRSTPISRAK